MEFWTGNYIQPNHHLFHLSLFKRKGMGFAGISVKMVFNHNGYFDCLAVVDNFIDTVVFIIGVFDCSDKAKKIQ